MTNGTNAAKLSVSLPSDLKAFADRYRRDHGLESRSEVIRVALEALRQAELAHAYAAHAAEAEHDPEQAYWLEAGVADGIEPDEAEW
jgi:Arc/MetJ-type ribon-helix-helix transcriptional regulator